MASRAMNPVVAFNQAQKESDTVYRNYSKAAGLSDTAFWILYSVAEREEAYTQRELCTSWFFPAQTINSALKDLCKKGIVRLEPVPDNRKNKRIVLTLAGERVACDVVLPLIEAEKRAFERMSAEKCEQFLAMTRYHVSLLKEEVGGISPAEP